MINFGDVTIFLTRPLSAAFLIAAAILMLLIALPSLRAKREVALQE
jgi:putative tricarboxylic transport membrane protein